MPTTKTHTPRLKDLEAELKQVKSGLDALTSRRDAINSNIEKLRSVAGIANPLPACGTGARRRRTRAGTLGIDTDNPVRIVRLVQAGFSFSRLARLQKATQLPWEKISRFVSIPQRTLTRRQSKGKLLPDESDRVWRASMIFDRAVELYEGDAEAARKWLQTPQPALGGAVPLEIASTEVGAKEVENLIGRIEHGVFT